MDDQSSSCGFTFAKCECVESPQQHTCVLVESHLNTRVARTHLCLAVLCTCGHNEENERPSSVYCRQCLAFSQIAVIHPSHSLSKHVLNACDAPAAARGSRDSVVNKNDKVPDYEVFTMQKPNGKIAFLAGRNLIDLLSELLHKPLHFSEGFKTLQSGTLVGGKRWPWNIAQRGKQDIEHDPPGQP